MLRPKNTKFRKHQKGSYKQGLKNFFYLEKAKQQIFCLETLQKSRLTAKQLDSARQVINKKIKPKSALVLKVFPDISVTCKPTEVRMGKGKGSVDRWVARVQPGRILFEIDGVPDEVALEALRLGAAKLPIRTKIVRRIEGI